MLITDARYDDDHLAWVAEQVCAAVPRTCVQLRVREGSDGELIAIASRLRDITLAHGALLMINRRPHLARRVNADGVHDDATNLRAHSDSLITSAPAHDDADVTLAKQMNATFVLVSPIFQSPQKQAPRGLSAISSARAIAGTMGVIALGGIDQNAHVCFAAGADGVACIRALLDAADPASVARRILRLREP